MRPRQDLLTPDAADAGMTLIELAIVLLLMSIVLSIVGSMFFSLSQTASRNDTMVTDEQAASTVLAQVSRDIRSAHSVSFSPFTLPVPSQELELQMNQPSGQWVEWVYTPTAATINGTTQSAHTFARYVGTSRNGPFTRSAPVVSTPVNVANGATTPVFSYFQGDGTNITNTYSPTTIQTCATRVEVTMQVATQKNITAVPTFQIVDDVAITDQEAQWETLPCPYVL
jgi:prepilin-type N-terminal cleavage/methylation domain-containing protein